MPADIRNIHATGLLVGDRGMLITGAAGSGKTTLALALLRAAGAAGRFARLVGDDQLLLESVSGRLTARTPDSIFGLTEVAGSGIHGIASEPRMVVHLVVRLVADGSAPRFQPDARTELCGIDLPLLALSARNAAGACHAVLARLSIPPFGPLHDGDTRRADA